MQTFTLIFYLGSLLSVNVLCSNPSVLCCSTMWYNGTVTAVRKLRIAYNISLRRLFGIPKYNSAREMFMQLNIKSLGELLRKYVFCFTNRLILSDNSIDYTGIYL